MDAAENLTVTIIGTGAVGLALADFFRTKNIPIRSVWNSREGTVFFGSGKEETIGRNLPANESETGVMVFITVPDDSINTICGQLAEKKINWKGRSVIHCSGNLTSEECLPLAEEGAKTVSMHPIQTFQKGDGMKRFRGITVSLEGDSGLTKNLAGLVQGMGASPLLIGKEQKRSLHIAAVFASNYLVSLMDTSETYLREKGIHNGLDILEPLILQTLENILNLGTTDALTGPVARGDIASIRKHLDALEGKPEVKEMYRVLGKKALEITERRGGVSDENFRKIRGLFDGE